MIDYDYIDLLYTKGIKKEISVRQKYKMSALISCMSNPTIAYQSNQKIVDTATTIADMMIDEDVRYEIAHAKRQKAKGSL